MIIYVVCKTEGSYDDKDWSIIKAYTNKEAAEKYAKKLQSSVWGHIEYFVAPVELVDSSNRS